MRVQKLHKTNTTLPSQHPSAGELVVVVDGGAVVEIGQHTHSSQPPSPVNMSGEEAGSCAFAKSLSTTL
jgi:hypothetical protein